MNDLVVLQVGLTGKKETFELAANDTLFSVLQKFCAGLGWDVCINGSRCITTQANNYTLIHNKSSKVLPVAQLSVPWRLAGYPNRTTFSVQRRPASEVAKSGVEGALLSLPLFSVSLSKIEVNVALTLPQELKAGPRLVAKFPSTTKVWEVLGT
jgi:hypothetical protein